MSKVARFVILICSKSTLDESYIKIIDKHYYVFFFISSKSHKITAYHVANNKVTQPAITALSPYGGGYEEE